ncbi:hypothetical protein BDN71DRAFT_1588611 [Pleurotus eryngii]|uniref:O-methyltransferase C-terminal domain-containing protein n=1 Tax=Pleurotus eryngii TaxID=5323 RepID=A0A9P5ZZV7_PLEER|nr:hypothetical protein BDN71DRAFT_1588611 [Pleurotus eryngii]
MKDSPCTPWGASISRLPHNWDKHKLVRKVTGPGTADPRQSAARSDIGRLHESSAKLGILSRNFVYKILQAAWRTILDQSSNVHPEASRSVTARNNQSFMSQNLAKALQSLWEGTEKNSKIADHRNNSFAFELAGPVMLDGVGPSNGALFMQIQRPDGGWTQDCAETQDCQKPWFVRAWKVKQIAQKDNNSVYIRSVRHCHTRPIAIPSGLVLRGPKWTPLFPTATFLPPYCPQFAREIDTASPRSSSLGACLCPVQISNMTFATLRALHAIIGDAITDIERVYAENSGAPPRERSPTPAPSPSPITPSTPYYPMDTPDDDIRRHHILYAPKEESLEDLLESNCREDGISLEFVSGLGLGAPFSPKGTKKSSQAKVRMIPAQDRFRMTFNSPPPSPMSQDTPSPATPASSRRTLRTWQSMAALSPSRRNRTRRDSLQDQSATASASTMPRHQDTATPPASHSHTPRRHVLRSLELPPPKSLHSPSSSSDPPTPSSEYLSFRTPPTPSLSYQPHLDFPSLDASYDKSSPAEILNASHPVIATSIGRIVAASGQLAAMVQTPFLTICDAVMQYHLPACMRLFEASHVPEILREAGPDGLHVEKIAERNEVDASKLAHVLRLLATHHILREVRPDVFALNRISSVVDTGKDAAWLLGGDQGALGTGTQTFTRDEMPTSNQDYDERVKCPEKKYEDTNGIAAFVGLCTDELFKAASYMTEAYYLSDSTKHSREPVHTPFNFAFNTRAGFFGWLEGSDSGPTLGTDGLGAELVPDLKTAFMVNSGRAVENRVQDDQASRKSLLSPREKTAENDVTRGSRFRLERFGKAMVGTASWEAPYAILHGFDWASLPPGSTIVDVGGGIGSTSMLLANEFASIRESGIDLGLKFVIQDRPVVVKMGEKAWRDQRPELLDCGTARFQVHDFFSPQPIKGAAIFLLRAVLHDWPDKFARRILLELRKAATTATKLVIADFVLPLACADNFGLPKEGKERSDGKNCEEFNSAGHTSTSRSEGSTTANGEVDDGITEGVEGVQVRLAPTPLLANLGKANANAYWMDLTMQVTFNSQERTLREVVALMRSSGWKVVRVTHATGSLFGYIVAVPVHIPSSDGISDLRLNEGTALGAKQHAMSNHTPQDAGSRCGTPTFGSRMVLPSQDDALLRVRGRFGKGRSATTNVAFGRCVPRSSGTTTLAQGTQQVSVTATKPLRKRPSPLSIPPPTTPFRGAVSPRQSSPSISRRSSFASLHKHSQSQSRVTSPIPAVPPLPGKVGNVISRPRSATVVAKIPTPLARLPPCSPLVPRNLPPVPQIPPFLTSPPPPNKSGRPASPAPLRQSQRTVLRRVSHVSLRHDTPRRRANSTINNGGAAVGDETMLGPYDMEAGVKLLQDYSS